MSRPESLVLVECNLDVSLLRELGIPRQRIRHAGGKGNICNYLRKLWMKIPIARNPAIFASSRRSN